MNAAKHTPGPWTNHGRQANVGGLPHSAVGAKTLLARVYSEAYGDVEQETANARLIAAAPDLLSALIEMEREKSDYMTRNNLGDPSKEHTNKMARAAIQRAIGA